MLGGALVVAGSARESLAAGAAGAADDKRPIPDYDGRPDAAPSFGDGALWVPRVLASPLYLTSEFALRRPIGAAVRFVEGAPSEGGEGRVTLLPTFVADLGFRPWLGAWLGVDRFPVRGTRLAVRAATFGVHQLDLGIEERIDATPSPHAADTTGATDRTQFDVALRADLLRRDDAIFHGLGPITRPDDRVRFGVDRLGAELEGRLRATRWLDARVSTGVRSIALRDADAFARPYTALFEGVAAALDTRARSPGTGSGVRLEADVEHASDVARAKSASEPGGGAPATATQWVRWGGALSASIDVTGTRRIVTASIAARFADPVRAGGLDPSPLEQVVLGGERLRGFLDGRLVGRSALVAAASWQWPAWAFVDGFVLVEAGNVFGPHLAGLSGRLLRGSAAIGLRGGGEGFRFELLTGAGTDPFGEGGRLSSFRLALSATRRF